MESLNDTVDMLRYGNARLAHVNQNEIKKMTRSGDASGLDLT